MLLEPKIGTLIRKLNPYTNGRMGTMLCGAVPTNLAALGADLTALGNAITAYAGAQSAANLIAIENAEYRINVDLGISDIELRIDNDFSQDYMHWTFRGQAQAVKRALCLTYQYELRDRAGAGLGIYATDHILIGYCGANG